MSTPDTAAVLEDLALSLDARAAIDRDEGAANAYENAAALLRRRALTVQPEGYCTCPPGYGGYARDCGVGAHRDRAR